MEFKPPFWARRRTNSKGPPTKYVIAVQGREFLYVNQSLSGVETADKDDFDIEIELGRKDFDDHLCEVNVDDCQNLCMNPGAIYLELSGDRKKLAKTLLDFDSTSLVGKRVLLKRLDPENREKGIAIFRVRRQFQLRCDSVNDTETWAIYGDVYHYFENDEFVKV